MGLLTTLFYILFVLAAIVLVVVILLQEGKGGGFGDALGIAGKQTFGVAAKGIQTFTAVTAGIFLASALFIHVLNRVEGDRSVVSGLGGDTQQESGAGAGAGAPAGGGDAGGAGGGQTGDGN